MSIDQTPDADCRVLDWLGADSNGVPYHLHPLNLMWSEAGEKHDLAIYRRVADRLAVDPAYWSSVIRSANWRLTLVGCVCLLVGKHPPLFEDMRFRFEAGSMVVPQLAVTMGLLYPEEARATFEHVLNTHDFRDNPKQLVSVDRVLVLMAARPASTVSLDRWNILDRDDAMLADRVVREHWDFWSTRV